MTSLVRCATEATASLPSMVMCSRVICMQSPMEDRADPWKCLRCVPGRAWSDPSDLRNLRALRNGLEIRAFQAISAGNADGCRITGTPGHPAGRTAVICESGPDGSSEAAAGDGGGGRRGPPTREPDAHRQPANSTTGPGVCEAGSSREARCRIMEPTWFTCDNDSFRGRSPPCWPDWRWPWPAGARRRASRLRSGRRSRARTLGP